MPVFAKSICACTNPYSLLPRYKNPKTDTEMQLLEGQIKTCDVCLQEDGVV